MTSNEGATKGIWDRHFQVFSQTSFIILLGCSRAFGSLEPALCSEAWEEPCQCSPRIRIWALGLEGSLWDAVRILCWSGSFSSPCRSECIAYPARVKGIQLPSLSPALTLIVPSSQLPETMPAFTEQAAHSSWNSAKSPFLQKGLLKSQPSISYLEWSFQPPAFVYWFNVMFLTEIMWKAEIVGLLKNISE